MTNNFKILFSGSEKLCSVWADQFSWLGSSEFYNGSFQSQEYSCIFDLNVTFDGKQKFAQALLDHQIKTPFIVCSLTSVTAELFSSLCNHQFPVIGTALFPGMENKHHLELTHSSNTDLKLFNEFSEKLKTNGFTVYSVKDSVGLVALRSICCIINEAVQLFQEKIATESDIDISMKLGTNYPNGPLEWADKLGLDLVLTVLDSLYREFGDDRYRASFLLRQMVRSNRLGHTSRHGFYTY